MVQLVLQVSLLVKASWRSRRCWGQGGVDASGARIANGADGATGTGGTKGTDGTVGIAGDAGKGAVTQVKAEPAVQVVQPVFEGRAVLVTLVIAATVSLTDTAGVLKTSSITSKATAGKGVGEFMCRCLSQRRFYR